MICKPLRNCYFWQFSSEWVVWKPYLRDCDNTRTMHGESTLKWVQEANFLVIRSRIWYHRSMKVDLRNTMRFDIQWISLLKGWFGNYRTLSPIRWTYRNPCQGTERHKVFSEWIFLKMFMSGRWFHCYVVCTQMLTVTINIRKIHWTRSAAALRYLSKTIVGRRSNVWKTSVRTCLLGSFRQVVVDQLVD